MNNFRCIIAGGREFNDYPLLEQKCNHILSRYLYNVVEGYNTKIEIVSGMADGADKLGGVYAAHNRIKVIPFPAKWSDIETSDPCRVKYRYNGDAYNVLAGHNRNLAMAEYAWFGGLILFWDGKSTGSKSMLKYAEECKLKIKVVRYEN